ncbi:MAG TPA: SgcJ/EcaC family oxidoreductase [Kofleriaceae bacterium]|nr:SgcJ/EcaC family oxidoreductase [Kofleriaceae bacterium]
MTVEDLYRQLIEAWNKRDADAYAELFIVDGEAIGFDGTQHTGRGVIHEQIKAIFAKYPTQPYTTKILGVTTVTTDVAIVRAIAGMAKPGQSALAPELLTVMRLTAVHRAGDWRIALLQSTPAQLHGRADEVARLLNELQAGA